MNYLNEKFRNEQEDLNISSGVYYTEHEGIPIELEYEYVRTTFTVLNARIYEIETGRDVTADFTAFEFGIFIEMIEESLHYNYSGE